MKNDHAPRIWSRKKRVYPAAVYGPEKTLYRSAARVITPEKISYRAGVIYGIPARVFLQSRTGAACFNPGPLRRDRYGTACGARMFITAGPRHGGRPGTPAGIVSGSEKPAKRRTKTFVKIFALKRLTKFFENA